VSLAGWIGIALLGGVGALARFGLDTFVSTRTGGVFPWGTLAVNASGSFVLGFVAGVALTGDALVLVGTGLVGSYTTFSTWMLETQRLGEDGEGRAALANLALSVVLGLVAVALGRAVGRAL
jgi:fluoride exporter